MKVLYQRAIELKKEGRKAEAMACLKRAKSLEADLRREAQGKGLVGSSEEEETEEGDDGGKRPSFVRQASARSRRSSLAAADAPPSAARAESRCEVLEGSRPLLHFFCVGCRCSMFDVHSVIVSPVALPDHCPSGRSIRARSQFAVYKHVTPIFVMLLYYSAFFSVSTNTVVIPWYTLPIPW